MLLAMASLILPRCVNPGSTMRFGRLRRWVQNFVYGRLEDRRKDRARLLDRNAFLWLASRERIKSKYAWGVIAIFAGLYGWIAMQFPNMMFDFAVAGVIMFLLHLVFKIWAASEVCSRLLQDRRSGALELLLSTPLSVREIADGQSQALGRLFLRPIAFVIGLEMLLLYYGLRTYGDVAADQDKVLLYVVAISTLLLDFWALKWVGLWLSLKGRSIERVLMGTLLRVLLVPWLIFALFIGMVTSAVLLQQREPNTTEVLGGWWVIALAVSALFGSSARKKFLREFRELAAGRFGSAEEAEQTPKPAAPRRKIRSPVFFRRHPITVSIFVVLAVLLLSGGIRGRYYHYKLNRALDRIRDEGKPVTLRDLVQYYPAVLPSENAFAMLEESRPNVASNRALPTRRNSTNVTSAEMESYRTLLSANRVVLEALWKLPEYRQGAFDQLTASGQFWIKSHIQSSYMAVLDADLMDLTQGGEAEVDRVSRTVFAMLAHARLLREQPLSFAQERAQEAVQRLAGALTFVFKRDLLDEAALDRMQKEVEGMKSGTNQLLRTLAVQRANMTLSYQNPGQSMGMGFRVPASVSLIEKIHAALGFGDQKLLEALEVFESAEEMATKPWPERLEAASKEEKWPALSWMGRTFYQTDLSILFWRDAAYLANLHLIEAGIAAKRFEQKNGRLPRSLKELVPEFLAEVPIDPYTGEPLRSVLNDRLIIYSVGADRMDNTAPGAPVNVWADFRVPVE
jgi:hypothetical protein